MGVRTEILLLLVLVAGLQAVPISPDGFIEGRVGYELDTLNANAPGRFIHQERIALGLKGAGAKYDYSLTLGGVMRGNSATAYSAMSPEYGVRTNIKPSSRFGLALFSYMRVRNPMQIRTDSLAYKEMVHGVKLQAAISRNTSLSVSTGLKLKEITRQDTSTIGQQFISMGLDQKLAGMQFRIRGETDAWDRENENERSTSMASIHWYGSPLKKLSWSATNSFFNADGGSFWRMAHRVKYDLSQRMKVWVNFQRGDFDYDSQTLLRQSFDARYRFQLNQSLGFDLMSKGNRVGVVDSLDIYHWRMYGLSTHWQVGGRSYASGHLDVGYKQSYRYGSGLDVLLNADESFSILRGKRFDLYIKDDLSAEFFMRMDEEDDPRYDIRNKIRLTSELSAGRSLRLGNNLKFHTHMGSDLDFSADTLRNAVIDEIYVKSYGQRTQVGLYFRTILAMVDPEDDLHYNINSRIYHQFTPSLNFSLFNTYRFGSDIYEDHLWLNASLKYQTSRSSYSLMLQNYGLAETFGEQGTSIWLRFVRQI